MKILTTSCLKVVIRTKVARDAESTDDMAMLADNTELLTKMLRISKGERKQFGNDQDIYILKAAP